MKKTTEELAKLDAEIQLLQQRKAEPPTRKRGGPKAFGLLAKNRETALHTSFSHSPLLPI
jgi:hypothetical protein